MRRLVTSLVTSPFTTLVTRFVTLLAMSGAVFAAVIATAPAVSAQGAAPAGGTATQSAAACRAGDAKACFDAGMVLIDKTNPAGDLVAGRALFERGCELGDRRSCGVAGQLFVSNGRGMTANHPKGVAYLDKACRMKDGYSCQLLGSAHLDGAVGLVPDRERGIAYFKLGCETPHKDSCDVLFNLLIDEVPARQARAKEVADSWGKACEAGLVSTCSVATVLAFDGGNGEFPQAVDWQLADRNALSACKNRVIQGCTAGEHMFSNPASRAYDPDRGRMYSDAACRLGTAVSCFNKASVLIVAEDYAEVLPAFAEGCRLGLKQACDEQQRWASFPRWSQQHGQKDGARIVLLDRMLAYGDWTGAFYIAINDFRSGPAANYVFSRAKAGNRLDQLRDIDLTAYSLWTTAPSNDRLLAERIVRGRLADHNARAAAAERQRRAELYSSNTPTRYVGSLGRNTRFLVCHRDVNGLCDFKVQDGL
ncbi:tetratricopeptide repeat protein [Paraurantiacibacter namhicola]|nr:sel1 repeat family protein [Paraurantiacibacter namhicola]